MTGSDRNRSDHADKRLIWHLSADFPDSIDPHKTIVIRTLLEMTGHDYAHHVISLNRRSPGMVGLARTFLTGAGTGEKALAPCAFEWGECLTYQAPPRGLLHRTCLERLADALAQRHRSTPPPALICGHKLTVEGIVAERLARKLEVPFALTIQGDTDTKIIAARPDLTPLFRRIFHSAAHVTVFAPWSRDWIEARLGPRHGPTALIPCPTELDQPLAPQAGGSGLVSLFHLKSHQRKNLAGMAKALRLLAARGSAPTLTIYGGGSPADLAAARASTGDAPGLSFGGPLQRHEVAERINQAAGFVLPSRRESFGLVFIEALFAGLPIIYPKGQAVSGYFDDAPFAIAVPANAPEALASAMARLMREEAAMKAALAKWQKSRDAARFQRPAIRRAYGAALAAALRQ
ncbi:MAG: glycosyltransferase [Erythrobacter sp.]